jgi:hydroxyacylglutathione hydrolase
MKIPHIIPLAVGQMAANCYIVSDPDSREGVIIDPGDDPEYISDTVFKHKIIPTRIVATHGHFDHIMGAFALSLGFGIPFFIHGKDVFLVSRMAETARHFLGLSVVDPAPAIDGTLKEGDTVHAGAYPLSVYHLPGHTPGSIGLYEKKSGSLFCGDTLFAGGGVGRTDHAYSSSIDLQKSLRKIFRLPEGTVLFCGHGEPSRVGAEASFHVQ